MRLSGAACHYGALACLEFLYEKDPHLDKRACLWAVLGGSVAAVDWLIAHGHGDFTKVDSHYRDYYALGMHGSIAMMQRVLQLADLHKTEHGYTMQDDPDSFVDPKPVILDAAGVHGRLELMKFLVSECGTPCALTILRGKCNIWPCDASCIKW